MDKRVFLSKSEQDTQKLAGQMAKDALGAKERKNAVILALEGELGGGKTTFVQGLAKALGVKEKITSPTFVILRRFALAHRGLGKGGISDKRFANFYHIDCYRLDDPKDLIELGFKEIFKNPKNLVAIEWADKVKSIIPKDAVWMKFQWAGEERKIFIF